MKLLFICTHNRCRSILAEAICNHRFGEHLLAASAGSQPGDAVHPLTLKHLQERGIPSSGLYSKSWDELQNFAPDAVITVCDSAAQEACPLWMGEQLKVHWGLADPSRAEGDEAAVSAAFFRVMDTLEKRLAKVAALEPGLEREELRTKLNKLAELY